VCYAVHKYRHSGNVSDVSLCSHSKSVILMLLVVSLACDDAKIRIWSIPEDGIDGTLTEPSSYLKGS